MAPLGDVVVAYLDEPPFGVPPAPGDPGARPSGCDLEVADLALARAGVRSVRYVLTDFPELIPGLVDGRWHMTTAIFVTPPRAGAYVRQAGHAGVAAVADPVAARPGAARRRRPVAAPAVALTIST